MSKLTYVMLAGPVIVAVFGAPALAEVLSFKADLSGSSEVPPVSTAARGTLTAAYDTSSRTLSWSGNISGLSGPLAAAHFHGPAEPGKNAGVLIPAPGVTSGAFEGSATLNEGQAKALMAGQTYFNVHTAAHPNGEARGQVVQAQ
jgi:hypothetical protein